MMVIVVRISDRLMPWLIGLAALAIVAAARGFG